MKTADALLAALKRHNPAKVRAWSGDDDSRDIAVPTRRKKWAQVIAAIDAKSWSRVELLDKSGSAIAYVDNDGPAREVEEFPVSFAGVGGQLMLGERIAALCMSAVAQAVKQRDDETKALLVAQREVVSAAVVGVREMAEAVKSIGEVYREQTVAAEDAALSRAAAEAAGGGDFKELMQALPQLLQMLPMLKMLASGEPAALPNGARKPA